ncbi:hypothetical protein J2S40_002974 [Nocardioides luteus]|uniref:Gram-positive cocci surface proteins LPxTG domain-containing protein n=1 Tax=Nocardioides luteus TaxID=1844 RepID=A0ABQ5SXF7_9ACTN|nr:hypothetical protein [Nocardioides luteus]MDR7311916.1 hypothetical protein [Nocardioides luteus]GGR67247.1 hypothetical protein GCM10010197_38500 [Nocardioides luteus]GLJ68159.1 hypothetical protein GCM10017579_21950 [Nocardioides luteus]
MFTRARLSATLAGATLAGGLLLGTPAHASDRAPEPASGAAVGSAIDPERLESNVADPTQGVPPGYVFAGVGALLMGAGAGMAMRRRRAEAVARSAE